eukprot:PhF_6_TR5124/c1_g1_i2/m.7268
MNPIPSQSDTATSPPETLSPEDKKRTDSLIAFSVAAFVVAIIAFFVIRKFCCRSWRLHVSDAVYTPSEDSLTPPLVPNGSSGSEKKHSQEELTTKVNRSPRDLQKDLHARIHHPDVESTMIPILSEEHNHHSNHEARTSPTLPQSPRHHNSYHNHHHHHHHHNHTNVTPVVNNTSAAGADWGHVLKTMDHSSGEDSGDDPVSHNHNNNHHHHHDLRRTNTSHHGDMIRAKTLRGLRFDDRVSEEGGLGSGHSKSHNLSWRGGSNRFAPNSGVGGVGSPKNSLTPRSPLGNRSMTVPTYNTDDTL